MVQFSLDKIIDEVDNDHVIILYDDDVNTFHHVMYQLCVHCGHGPFQANQCTTLTDKVGQCEVKKGSLSELEPIAKKLRAAGLRVELN